MLIEIIPDPIVDSERSGTHGSPRSRLIQDSSVDQADDGTISDIKIYSMGFPVYILTENKILE